MFVDREAELEFLRRAQTRSHPGPGQLICLEVVQRVLGHRDPRSTQGYADLAEAQVRAALETP